MVQFYFDLQRFATSNVLVGGGSSGSYSYSWQNGMSFVGEGTYADPAVLAASGTSGATAAITTSGAFYLTGTSSGYSFTTEQTAQLWEVQIKNDDNVISGNYGSVSGAYGLKGDVDITIYDGKEFAETVNEQNVSVKAASASVAFTLTDRSNLFTDQFDYAFVDQKDFGVKVDDDDKAILYGANSNVTIAGSSATINAANFSASATVSASGDDLSVETGDNTITNDNGTIKIVAESNNVAIFNTNDEFTAVQKLEITPNDSTFFAQSQDFTVNNTPWTVQGAVGSLSFVMENDVTRAQVHNSGAVTVQGSAGNFVGFAQISTITANGTQIIGNGGDSTFAMQLGSSGIAELVFDQPDSDVQVIGQSSIAVKVDSLNYTLASTTNSLKFDAANTSGVADIDAKQNQGYTVSGAQAQFMFEDNISAGSTATVTINGAQVNITNNTSDADNYIVTQNTVAGTYGTGQYGVDVVKYLAVGDKVSVANDSDGFTAIYNDSDATIGQYFVNQATVDVKGSDESGLTFVADDSNISVVGAAANAVITLRGGSSSINYHIKDDNTYNRVNVAANGIVFVTLDSAGDVAQYRSQAAEQKLAAEDDLWNQIATIGAHAQVYDTVASHQGTVYHDEFYHLATAAGTSYTIAGYDAENYSTVISGSSNVNIIGQTPQGTPVAIGEAAHITLEGAVGNVPINIEHNESRNAQDVNIYLTASNRPSTVAIGTTGYNTVSANHNVFLSSVAGAYAYLGASAIGQNAIFADGAAMMRHNGDDYRASLIGGDGNDTIWAAKRDYVAGNGGADYFSDRGSYTITDYDASAGDVIIASNAETVDEAVGKIAWSGNVVSFGGNELTLGNRGTGENLYLKVGVTDSNGNVAGSGDVYVENSADALNATASYGAYIFGMNLNTGANYSNVITGSDGADTIVAGQGDSVLSGAGNDQILLSPSGGQKVGLLQGSGHDSVFGWMYNMGFDDNNATELYAAGQKVTATIRDDTWVLGIGTGDSLTLLETKGYNDQFELLVDGKKYMLMRSKGFAIVDDSSLADEYFAVADGQLVFLGTTETQSVDLNSDKFQNIRAVGLLGNGADSIIGTDARETVVAAAELDLANGHKHISMGGGNDYIVSSKGEYTFLGSKLKSSDWYTSTQGNVFYFGAGDGRDTIQGLAHYTGIDDDPDLQKSDQIVLGTFTDVKVSTYSDGTDRVVLSATDSDDLVVYEKSGISNYDKETYWVRRSDINEEGIAKIGYSDTHARGGNTFTYDQEVKYYIGSSGTARDTLVVDGNDFNVGIWLDSRGSYEPDENFQYRFYRGIGVVDATAATNTQVSIAGSVDNNTLIGGGEGTTSYLWGGAGNNSLVGGAGHDFFMYYKESRNLTDGGAGMENANQDTISGYVADVDTIFLGDITLDDINSAAMVARGNNGIGDDAVVLDFNNGGTLTIEDSSQNIKVTTSDGATYVANRSTKQWETA